MTAMNENYISMLQKLASKEKKAAPIPPEQVHGLVLDRLRKATPGTKHYANIIRKGLIGIRGSGKVTTASVEGDGPDLNFFERHPKKILGALALAGAATQHKKIRGLPKLVRSGLAKKKWQKARAVVKERAADLKHQAKKRANEGFAHPRKDLGHEKTEIVVLRRGGKGAAETDLHRAVEGKLRGREVLDINNKPGRSEPYGPRRPVDLSAPRHSKTDYVHHSHGKAEHI
jgi:hypothetical protein